MKRLVAVLALACVATAANAQDTGHPIWGHQLEFPAGISESERITRTADVVCDVGIKTKAELTNLETQMMATVDALGNAIDRNDRDGVRRYSVMLAEIISEQKDVAIKRGYALANCETYMKLEEQAAK